MLNCRVTTGAPTETHLEKGPLGPNGGCSSAWWLMRKKTKIKLFLLTILNGFQELTNGNPIQLNTGEFSLFCHFSFDIFLVSIYILHFEIT